KEKANRDIRDDRLLLLVGSLVYVEKQRAAVFQEYFKGKKYEDLNETIRRGFGSSDAVQDMKYEHQRKLVLAFLEWKPPSGTVDGPINPFRSKLLEMGDDLNLVLARMYPASGTGIPLPLIWLLGEIGHQNAFDILLQEYLARPSMRTAVSLGSCLGSLSPNYLFEAPFTSESTRELLQYIYGDRWEDVKGLSDDELKQNMLIEYEAIKADCRRRSIPQLG
ncbi:MAG: hypothetical protein K8F91_06075, partial [Candidatus Obscuribacterales bacterium]|nr:hypothetical protein [Candidatus Obscuribacterales bacterium]